MERSRHLQWEGPGIHQARKYPPHRELWDGTGNSYSLGEHCKWGRAWTGGRKARRSPSPPQASEGTKALTEVRVGRAYVPPPSSRLEGAQDKEHGGSNQEEGLEARPRCCCATGHRLPLRPSRPSLKIRTASPHCPPPPTTPCQRNPAPLHCYGDCRVACEGSSEGPDMASSGASTHTFLTLWDLWDPQEAHWPG